ncbi:protein PRRC1-A-like isoform X2 [Littorina saxatilis]|uniref:Non-canonical purine NTP phosphatase/PRRC1 domain-containing protein n=1 Tax=Littorina saxatilis TaxID=31220 RepID=A0AAN9GPN1_9CAEN
MMEEMNDEQPEIVTHEEVALAEKEAAQSSAAGRAVSSTVAAPSPLPSFLASSTPSSTPTTQASTPARPASKPTGTVSPSTQASGVTPTTRSTPSREAPGPMQTPFEASSAIAVSPAAEEQQPMASGAPGGLFGWFSNNSLVNRVVEKTKSSMESVITTLDPGMKEVIRSGGEIDIVVTSTKDSKLLAIREAFQQTFGRATVTGKEGQATTAAQPVGFTAGLKGAEDRINALQRSGEVPEGIPVVSIEGFIVEMFPDKWYEMSCLILRDPVHGINLETCSQPTFIPSEYIMAAQDQTPADYPLRWAGLAVTIGQVIEKAQPHIGRADWQKVLSGVSRRDSLFLAALTLAHMYRQNLPSSLIS